MGPHNILGIFSFLLLGYIWYLRIISGLWRHLAWVVLTNVVVGIYKLRLWGLDWFSSAGLPLMFLSLLRSYVFHCYYADILLRYYVCCSSCAVDDDCCSFSWWRVSRILLLFGGFFMLGACGRLDLVIIVLLSDNIDYVCLDPH